MLQHRVRPWTRPWCSLRPYSQLKQSPGDPGHSFTKTTRIPENGALLSRLSDRIQSATRRTEQKGPRERVESRPPATSFISARSVQHRDHAAEKWFTNVRKLDINDVSQSDDLQPLSRKKRSMYELPKQHRLRPKTDLDALFSSPTLRSAMSLRLQTKKELGGDYTSYLPGGYADPYRLPVDYARLLLGRNKHMSLTAQAGALNIIEEVIRSRT